jgi:hypothetical protein
MIIFYIGLQSHFCLSSSILLFFGGLNHRCFGQWRIPATETALSANGRRVTPPRVNPRIESELSSTELPDASCRFGTCGPSSTTGAAGAGIVNGGNFDVTTSSSIEWLRFWCDSGLFKFADRSGGPAAGNRHIARQRQKLAQGAPR